MLSRLTSRAAKLRVAALTAAGALVAGFAGPAAAATASAPEAAPAPQPSPASYFQSERANDPCTNITALTTRPTVTNSVCVVPKGHALIEAGYVSTKDQASGQRSYVYPQALLRVGTDIKNLEVQVQGPSEFRSKNPATGTTTHALGDSAVGAKYFLGSSKRFAHSVQVNLGIPTGDAGQSTGGFPISGSYNAQYAINHIFGLQATETLSSQQYAIGTSNNVSNPSLPNVGSQRFGNSTTSLVASAAVPKIANVFAEEAVYSHPAGSGTSGNQFTGGVSKAVSDRLQLDVEYTTSNFRSTGGPTSKAHGFGGGLSFYL